MIEILGVHKSYAMRDGEGVTETLRDVNLTAQSQEFLSIIGPSGCGKTTLLKIVAGLVEQDQGEVRINGEAISGPGTDRGMVFQNFALLPWANVLDNVAYGLRLRGIQRQDRHQLAREQISAVGLEGFEQHYPHELSGGMQQRVGLARALAVDPHILLMDEPFSAVDAQTRRRLQLDLLRICESSAKTVIFVTHNMSEAVRLGDRVALLSTRPGRVLECLDVQLPRPRTDEVERLPAYSELKEYLWQKLKTMGQNSVIES